MVSSKGLRSGVVALMGNGFSVTDISDGVGLGHPFLKDVLIGSRCLVSTGSDSRMSMFYDNNKERRMHPASSLNRAEAIREARLLLELGAAR